jgi:psiF repeat
MRDCLKAGMPASQQEKTKACNKDASAKALKGEERKAFMSTCLAGAKSRRMLGCVFQIPQTDPRRGAARPVTARP